MSEQWIWLIWWLPCVTFKQVRPVTPVQNLADVWQCCHVASPPGWCSNAGTETPVLDGLKVGCCPRTHLPWKADQGTTLQRKWRQNPAKTNQTGRSSQACGWYEIWWDWPLPHPVSERLMQDVSGWPPSWVQSANGGFAVSQVTMFATVSSATTADRT